MIFTDIPIYIYIYRNAWALPQSCTIEVPIHIQLGRSTKVLGKIYSRRRCGSGQSPGIWRTYIYIYIVILYGHDCHMITCFDVPMILCSANANEFPILCFGAYCGCILGFLVVPQFWLT